MSFITFIDQTVISMTSKRVAKRRHINRAAAKLSTSFVYCVSVNGVTGSKSPELVDKEAVPRFLKRCRDTTSCPLALGFGIGTRHQFLQASDAGADAVVIGSKIIRVLQSAQPGQEIENLKTFMRSILGDKST